MARASAASRGRLTYPGGYGDPVELKRT